MKPEDDNSSKRWSVIGTAFIIVSLFAIFLFATSCTVTFHPDGSRTVGLDAESIARAARVYNEK